MSTQPLTPATRSIFISFPATDLSVRAPSWQNVMCFCVPNEAVFIRNLGILKQQQHCLGRGNKSASLICGCLVLPHSSSCSLFLYHIHRVFAFCWNTVTLDTAYIGFQIKWIHIFDDMQKDKQKVMFHVDTAKKEKLDPKLPLRPLKSSIGPSFWWPSMKLADIATLINLRVTFLVGVGELQPVMSLSRSTECSVRLPAVVRGSKEGAGLGGEGCGQRKNPQQL